MTGLSADLKHTHSHPGDAQLPGWRLAAAGLSASLVGIGLARLAYTPADPRADIWRSTLDWP